MLDAAIQVVKDIVDMIPEGWWTEGKAKFILGGLAMGIFWLIISTRAGIVVGGIVAILGAIALMFSTIGFLFLDSAEVSFKRPLIAIGVGVAVIIISSIFSAISEWWEKN